MTIKKCEICGCEFKALTISTQYCNDCKFEMYKSIKPEQPKRNPNQRLIDDANRATELGLSYGVYMGGTYAHKRL